MLLIGSDPLTRFLNHAAETPFAWGRFDCLLWLADWIEAQTGIDPAAELRGTYATLLGAARIVQEAGGMARLVDSRLAPLAAVRASEPQRGAIAVVSIAGDGGEHFGDQAGAILLSGAAVFLGQTGLVMLRRSEANIVAAWRV